MLYVEGVCIHTLLLLNIYLRKMCNQSFDDFPILFLMRCICFIIGLSCFVSNSLHLRISGTVLHRFRFADIINGFEIWFKFK